MSERMTGIYVAGARGLGIADHGRVSRAEMISRYRAYWQRQLELAQRALAAPDADLRVETYLGPWARKNVEDVTD